MRLPGATSTPPRGWLPGSNICASSPTTVAPADCGSSPRPSMPSLLQIQEPGATPEPGADDGSIAVGIDLGTTNSVIAVSRNGAPEVLRDEDGAGLVPSVVAYAHDGSAIVGELARRLLLDRPEVVVSSVKRLMGRGAGDLKALAGTL